MPTCIYCLEAKADDGFRRREHVLPDAFGSFGNALTLHDAVCDDCNQFFGDTVERHLARDTPDGLNRFLLGGKDPAEFRPVGRKSSLVHRADSGPLRGAQVVHRQRGGLLEVTPLPQVAFGRSEQGPWEKWFNVDALPSREELQSLIRDGFVHVQFREVKDENAVVEALKERGAVFQGSLVETIPAGWSGTVRVETVAQLGVPFGRAITKIAMNYLAHEYGAQTARMAEFDVARKFARYGGRPDEERIWAVLAALPTDGRPLGHSLAIEWDRQRMLARGVVSFFSSFRYEVILGAHLQVLPAEGHEHFFDCSTMQARRLR